MTQTKVNLCGILVFALSLILAAACGGGSTAEAPTATRSAPSSNGTSGSSSSSASESRSTPAQTDSQGSEDNASAQGTGEKIRIVATSSIVADWVRTVGGERVEVFSLLPSNADPHTFQPGAQDITRVADAGVVFSIGLSLEGGWLSELIENAAGDQDIVVPLGDAVDPIGFVEIVEDHHEEAMQADQDEEGEEEGHDGKEEEKEGHSELDPHFWFDPIRVKQAVEGIAVRLSTVDPDGKAVYRDNAEAFARELDDLHLWIEEQVETLPEGRRVLVTSHDSFQYFAVRYGFEVAGAIFPVSTDAEPTAKELGELIEIIEHEGVPAVFTENSHSERLARRIAEETGATLVGGLYTGSLGEEGGEAGTYLDLMRHNTTTIVEALR